MTYSRAFKINGDDSIQRVIKFLSIASLDDKLNGWGLEVNLFHLFAGKGYTRDEASHNARYLFLLVKRGIISTTETRAQYDYVDARLIAPV